MYARYNHTKFYKEYGDYYPLYRRPVDYTILLPKVIFLNIEIYKTDTNWIGPT